MFIKQKISKKNENTKFHTKAITFKRKIKNITKNTKLMKNFRK